MVWIIDKDLADASDLEKRIRVGPTGRAQERYTLAGLSGTGIRDHEIAQRNEQRRLARKYASFEWHDTEGRNKVR